MKKIKLIRIDETPRKFPQSTLKILTDSPDERRIFGQGSQFTKPPFLTSSFPQKREQMGRNRQSFGSAQHLHGAENSEVVEMPPHIVSQLIRTNDLIVAFSAELEQQKVPVNFIREFQHDSFKIGLKVTEGIFLHNIQPHLAGRQFDLVVIHIENTLITLENFEAEKIISSFKINHLKKACGELMPLIHELKEYFELE
jgi:hypothetical protein